MQFFEKLKGLKLNFGTEERRKPKASRHIQYGVDPTQFWREEREIGDGAFGKVYLTRNTKTGAESALKQMVTSDECDLESFSIEVNILSEFEHQNIVTLFESYFYKNKLWMYMEYCEGGAIDSIMLNLERPLTEAQIACLSSQACKALDFLHSPKVMVIHRDLKAGNLLLNSDGVIKLADFGVSARMESTKQTTDTYIGTPYWMAPEVIKCETIKLTPYSFKSDIWSLGITLIECSQINPPHNELHPMRVLIRILKSHPPTLSRPSDWSKVFNNFVDICLKKEPEDRASSSDLLHHPFITGLKSNLVLKQLYIEATAEVIEETKEEVDEDTESMDKSSSSSSMLDLSYSISSNKSLPTTPTSPSTSSPFKPSSPTTKTKTTDTTKLTTTTETTIPKTPEVLIESGRTKKAPPPPKSLPNLLKNINNDINKNNIYKVDKNNNNNNSNDHLPKQPNQQSTTTTPVSLDTSLRKYQWILDSIIEEVIMSNQNKPSVPSVVFDTIVSLINGEEMIGGKENSDATGEIEKTKVEIIRINSNPDEDFDLDMQLKMLSEGEMDEISENIYIKILEDVLSSTNRQPSLSGVVLDFMTETMKEESEMEDIQMEGGEIEGERNIYKKKENSLKDGMNVDGHKRESSRMDVNKKDGSTNKKEASTIANNIESIRKENSIDAINDNIAIIKIDNTAKHQKITNVSKTKRENGTNKDKSDLQQVRRNGFKRTMTRTRKYTTEEGKVVTSTTTKVLTNKANDLITNRELMLKCMREMKMQRKIEARHLLDLDIKVKYRLTDIVTNMEKNKQTATKLYDLENEQIGKYGKQQMDKLEDEFSSELKVQEKKLKVEQEQGCKLFLEQHRMDLKGLQLEPEDLERVQTIGKKSTLKIKKTALVSSQAEKERKFHRDQEEGLSMMRKRLLGGQKRRRGEMEMKITERKHLAIKTLEKAIWTGDEKAMVNRNGVTKKHVRQMFIVKRQHMITRQNMEMQSLDKSNESLVDELNRKQMFEKKKLPKNEKYHSKLNYQTMKKRLRDEIGGEGVKEKLAEFEEIERQKVAETIAKLYAHHRQKMLNMWAENQIKVKDLEQIQKEKLSLLKEQETALMGAMHKQGEEEMEILKKKLKSKKKKLEDSLSEEIRRHNDFYTTTHKPNQATQF